MQKITLFVTLNLLFFNLLQSQNLLVNGDFESGSGIGFAVSGVGYSQIFAPFSGTTSPGNYAITANPQPMNVTNFIAGGDHTSGSGKMLVIDGNTTAGQQTLWAAGNGGGGVCSLTTGVTYTFSFWIKSVSTSVTNAITQAQLGVNILNASAVTLVSGNLSAPLPSAGWQKITYTFIPVQPCVNIKVFNNNTNTVGNDFALDDLSVISSITPLALTYSTVNYSCVTSNDGAITAYASGGGAPYSYSISGPTTAPSNTTGFFPNLTAGIYTVSVVDGYATTVWVDNVVINAPSNPLTVSPNTTSCLNSNTTLTVAGGTTYNWTASPTDLSLTTPSASSIVVSPLSTTIYTVTSNINSISNLIFNGDFFLGNNGFATDYGYYNPNNSSGLQRAYGVVTNASSWAVGFSACVDHTTATGKMMVVDGSNLNSGNDKIWSQSVPVVANQTYTFSYWTQSVSTANPALIEIVINGVIIGSALAPSNTCGWVQRSYTWNSGASTTAQIAIYDRVTATNGNDFALDDISFASSTNCTFSKSVQVTISEMPMAIINYLGTPYSNLVTTPEPVSITGTGNYAGGSFISTVGLSINASTGAITPSTSIPGTYTVSYVIPPSAGCSPVVATTQVTIINNLGTHTIKQEEFMLYPNPASDTIHLVLGSNADQTTTLNIKVYNTLGQIVEELPIVKNTTALATKNWGTAGVYFVQITNQSDNRSIIKKVIVKRQ